MAHSINWKTNTSLDYENSKIFLNAQALSGVLYALLESILLQARSYGCEDLQSVTEKATLLR